jgi:hypothetical protein
MNETDTDLRDRLVAMESRLGTAEPPALPARRIRRLALSIVGGSLLVLALVATAAAGVIVIGGPVRGFPGVENPGQPLAGAQMECMTPPQAAAFIAAHGITKVQWQVEQDDPSADVPGRPGSKTLFQGTAPETGIVVAGAIVDGTLLMLVDQRGFAARPPHCVGK